MAFKIESNIPALMPKASYRKYPFNEMKPGDSFLINGDAAPSVVSTSTHAFGRKHGWKFSVRKTPDGHRCWRIS